MAGSGRMVKSYNLQLTVTEAYILLHYIVLVDGRVLNWLVFIA